MTKTNNVQEGTRRIKFFTDATVMGLPFIRINEGDFKGIVFMIDTGSNENVMFGYAYQLLKDLLRSVEGSIINYGIDGKQVELNYTCGTFSFCSKEYDMTFVVREDDIGGKQLSEDVGFPITGMIGTKFMLEHGWMIDFANQEIVIRGTN